jgi:hypothetical protein
MEKGGIDSTTISLLTAMITHPVHTALDAGR